MARTEYRGVVLTDTRTAAQLAEAERLLGFKLVFPQGSYSNGSLSAGTHTGGGTVDISVRGMSEATILRTVKILRSVGLVAWWRREPEWHDAQHIHAVSMGCPDLAGGASAQVADYKRGRNGLANHLADRHAKVKVVLWETYLSNKAKAAKLKKAAAAAAAAAALLLATHGGGNPAPKPVPTPAPVVVPVAPKPAPFKAATLRKAVKPGKHDAQVKVLQTALRAEHYGKLPAKATDYYGHLTEQAVAAFYKKHPEFSSGRGDTAIGPRGFVFLQKAART